MIQLEAESFVWMVTIWLHRVRSELLEPTHTEVQRTRWFRGGGTTTTELKQGTKTERGTIFILVHALGRGVGRENRVEELSKVEGGGVRGIVGRSGGWMGNGESERGERSSMGNKRGCWGQAHLRWDSGKNSKSEIQQRVYIAGGRSVPVGKLGT